MNLKIGSIWEDRYEKFSRVKIVGFTDDYYKKIQYEWIYCEIEKSKIGKTNYLSEKSFLDIYELVEMENYKNYSNSILTVTDESQVITVTDESRAITVTDEQNKKLDSTNIKKNDGVNYKHKTIITSSNKTIEIFDDIFTTSERQYYLDFIQNCYYVLGNNSKNAFWQKNKTFFQAPFTKQNLDKLGILDTNSFDNVRSYLSDQHSIQNSWAIVSSPFSTYCYHVDTSTPNSTGKTLLYFANDRWDRNWGGETLFADENGESEYAIEYKPGRIVIFDNSIEHRPAFTSIGSDEFKFTFVIQFLTNRVEETNHYHHHHN